jgi:hypothetical protein
MNCRGRLFERFVGELDLDFCLLDYCRTKPSTLNLFTLLNWAVFVVRGCTYCDDLITGSYLKS